MKPGIVYTLSWDLAPTAASDGGPDRIDAKLMVVSIYDYGHMIDDDANAEVIVLTPAAAALDVSVINNDENKFAQIRAKQAKIRFISDQGQGQDINIFSDAYDNQFYVVITCNAVTMFLGYLMLPDGQMPFQPDPNVVELTASDHLPLLKDISLVDDSGDNILGKYRIAELIALCLKKTGLSLPINVINNLRHGGGILIDEVDFADAPDGDDFIVLSTTFNNFYAGQSIVISGTVSNNGTFTVTAVTELVGKTVIFVAEALTTESNVTATFSDASSLLHLYDGVYLDAKTFEAEIGASENAYSVLEKIFGDDCAIFQYKAEWWIIRIDEYDGNPLYKAKFDADGVLIDDPAEIDLNYSIGFDQNVLFAAADQILRFDRPHKFVKETFRYENPLEIVCNVDFDRGDVITPPDLAAASSEGTYNVDCWTLHRYSGGSPTSTMYIRRVFEFGYEKQRYLVVTPASSSSETTWAESQPIPVQVKDRANINVEYSAQTDFGSGEGNVEYDIVFLFIIDTAGEYWYWSNIDAGGGTLSEYQWVGPFPAETNRPVSESWILGDVDETDPRTLFVEMSAFPVTGNLYIGLPQFNQTGSGFDDNVIIQYNISFQYSPFVNGSYEKYTGHTNSVSTALAGYAAKRENEVFIGDAPKPITKGAMFVANGLGGYTVTARFYPSAKYAITGQPDADQIQPYGWHQAYAVWNQYRMAVRIFTGSLQGLGDDWPDLLHRIILTDNNPNTTGRYFLLISFQQDWRTGSWRGTFIECFNEDNPRSYTDPEEFKYLTGG